MADEQNALAVLASRLNPDRMTYDDLDMAQRIVSELAKVGFWMSTGRPHFDEAVRAVSNCRAIAEEGARDAD